MLAAYDFTRFATIADIDGGRDHLLRAVRGGKIVVARMRVGFYGTGHRGRLAVCEPVVESVA